MGYLTKLINLSLATQMISIHKIGKPAHKDESYRNIFYYIHPLTNYYREAFTANMVLELDSLQQQQRQSIKLI